MSKGDKNTRVKNWSKYWAEYDQIFKKDKFNNIKNLPNNLQDTPPEIQKVINDNFEELITEIQKCPNCKEKRLECGCIRNKCRNCGKSVGNITFSYCDECWEHKKIEN